MLFTQLEFLIFFLLFLVMYFGVPLRHSRYLVLFVFSYFFYGFWNAKYIVLIVVATLVNYAAALWIERDQRHAKLALSLAAFTSLGILGVFKYYNFFVENLNSVFGGAALVRLDFLLPVGISFYTFQALGYTVDVYRGEMRAERNLLHFTNFISFFPQLVAGPIEKASNLLPQLKKRPEVSWWKIISGIHWILLGLFKKIVVADNIAPVVDQIYSSIGAQSSWVLALGTYLFAFQIYCDFSGYCDIAVGCARIIGVDLMENFRTPYVAKSVTEFWHRWHISLSQWFRDYVYIPLGGSRVDRKRFYINVLVTFVLSGFWHGAKWTFIVWGLLHGICLIVEKKLREFKAGAKLLDPASYLGKSILVFVIFNLVCLGWIFFRADSVGDAFWILERIFSLAPSSNAGIRLWDGAALGMFFPLFVNIALLIAVDSIRTRQWAGQIYWSAPGVVRFLAVVSVVLFIFFAGATDSRAFIYFQF